MDSILNELIVNIIQIYKIYKNLEYNNNNKKINLYKKTKDNNKQIISKTFKINKFFYLKMSLVNNI